MQYLMTLNDLYDKALVCLGPMDQWSYESSMQKAKLYTDSPLLVIDLEFNPDYIKVGMLDQPYHITENEWDEFCTDAQEVATHMPNVYIVDGQKYCISAFQGQL